MKFDKETAIAVVICIGILFAWEPFCRYMGWMPDIAKKSEQVETAAEKSAEKKSEDSKKDNVEKTAETADLKDKDSKKEKAAVEENVPEVKKLPLLELKNKHCIIKFKDDYSAIDKIVFNDFKNNKKDGNISISNDYDLQNGMLSVNFAGLDIISNEVDKYSLLNYKKVIITNKIKLKDETVILLDRIYELNDDYTVKFDIAFKSDKDILIPSFKISGGNMSSWSYLSGDKIRSDKLEIITFDHEKNEEDLDCTDSDEDFRISPSLMTSWEAINNKFFAIILKGNENFTPGIGRSKLEGKKQYLVTINAQYANVKLDKNSEKKFAMQLYAGPKDPALLKTFAPECTTLIHLAWGPLNPLAKGMLWLLNLFEKMCHSYGWSIILLTVVVRLLFWPVTQKSNESMKKMQKLQPQLKEIREKYKDNPQLINAKTMELYQQEKVNPLGGCLPILLQIPVFFALYATLDNALELRQVPFWWAADLATADTVWSHPLGFSFLGISNLKLNPLVIVMTVLMVLQQRLTPSAMDPAQQKMMALMPVIMLIFLYDLPSGLTLYWTVSQIFSLLQVYLQRVMDKRKSAKATA